MAKHKVEITGINTSLLKVLTQDEMNELFIKFKEGDNTKKVRIIELDLIFNSLKECSQWLIDNHYSRASTMEAARKSLSRALNGDRATYCGLHFEFIK